MILNARKLGDTWRWLEVELDGLEYLIQVWCGTNTYEMRTNMPVLSQSETQWESGVKPVADNPDVKPEKGFAESRELPKLHNVVGQIMGDNGIVFDIEEIARPEPSFSVSYKAVGEWVIVNVHTRNGLVKIYVHDNGRTFKVMDPDGTVLFARAAS